MDAAVGARVDPALACPDMETTALICPVPRVAPLVAPWRTAYDASAAAGIPPHVTVLAPFLPPGELTVADLETLRALFERHAPVEAELTEVGMFDNEVLHLRPAPQDEFLDLTRAVFAAFPQAPPYGGRHPDLVAHLTVGKAIPRPRARHAARALMLSLPVRIRVDVVQLWAQGTHGWFAAASFPLGLPHGPAAPGSERAEPVGQ